MRTLFVCVLLLASTAMCEEPNTEAVRARVIDFCNSEFRGDQAKELTMMRNSSVDVGNLDEMPVDLVRSYKVISIKIEGNLASAVVEYDLIGRFKNVRYDGLPDSKSKFDKGVWIDRADKLEILHDTKFRQTLSLKRYRADNKWYIVSLQTPKLSTSALLDLLTKEVNMDKDTLSRNRGKYLPNIEAGISWNEHKIKLIESLSSTVRN
ncbi:MAG: hypothetical protein ABR991_03885 [Terracidiphilus sp.]